MKKIIFLLFFILLFSYLNVEAHSGRTDAYGCHNDNIHGGYHCHNGGYDAQTDYDRGYQEGYNLAYGYTSEGEGYEWRWEGSQAYGNGFEDGIKQGEIDGEAYYQEQIQEMEEYYQQQLEEDTYYSDDNNVEQDKYFESNESIAIYSNDVTETDNYNTEEDYGVSDNSSEYGKYIFWGVVIIGAWILISKSNNS